MLTEINVDGIYIAPFALHLLMAVPPFLVLRWVLSRTGVLSRLWYLALCEVCLFVVVLFLTLPVVLL